MGRKLINDDKLLELLKEGKTQKQAAAYFNVSEAAVSKRMKRLSPLPESLENLSEKEKKFALEVAGGKTQTQAALNSFEVSSMDSAKSLGSELMQKPSIRDAVSDLLEWYGMGRVFRIKKLRTHADNRDPGVSLKSIDIANKMDRIYVEEKPDQIFMTKQELNVSFVNSGMRRKDILRMEAELVWIDDKITDKEFKDFLKDLWGKKKDFELDDMQRWLLEKNGIPEAEIEAEVRKSNDGMTGMYEVGDGFGPAG